MTMTTEKQCRVPVPMPEHYRNLILFKKEAIFTSPLRKPVPGEKVYSLTETQIKEIRSIRGMRDELDPGMGGVVPSKIRSWMDEGIKLTSLDFMLTKRCNFKCTWCFAASGPQESEYIPFDRIESAVSQAAKIGTKFYILTGGEPLMYRDLARKKGFFDVVDLILDTYSRKNETVKILVFDDVALVTPAIAAKLAERRVALCTKGDTLDAGLQDYKLQTPGAWRQMMKGYENLWKAGYGDKNGPAIVVNTVLDHTTFEGMVDLHVWVKEHGMEHSIVPVHYCGNAVGEDQEAGIHSPHVKVLYDLLSRIDRDMFGDVWTPWSAFPKNKTCNRNMSGLHIRANGLVTACSESPAMDPNDPHKTDRYIFGNINQTDIKDIVDSEKLAGYRKEFQAGAGEYVCNSEVCDLYRNDLCRGGCATRSAYSAMDYQTGLISSSTDRHRYSQFREDPLCPAWTLLAQKQGVLRPGLLEEIHVRLIQTSQKIDKQKYARYVSMNSSMAMY